MVSKIITSHSNTAILIFAQNAEADAQYKSLAANQQLMDVLNSRVIQQVEKSGLDYFHFTEKEQEGIGFGKRFSNAIQRVIKKGYDQVICVGNDTPQLSCDHLLRAADSLNQGKAVNGPSLDGGFYLMGIHASSFDAISFENLPWQTGHLATSYMELLERQSKSVDVLEHLHDLDDEDDIHQLFKGKDLRWHLAQLILETLYFKPVTFSLEFSNTESVSLESPLNKGSPISIAA
ncbi:hypothetical protein BST86_09880 [Nonlabens agnitus]|uniref:Glycosyltransferase n=2 Tax=Nonlabens agnitus TaxID=870484 RepID=A0A2S9WV67_9FLAO|nr:hypothetical protein BST86_09880 [Nonlabens agnitus]